MTGIGARIDAMHHDVVNGFAKSIWAQAYAQAVEEMVESDELEDVPWRGGDDVSEYVPSVPGELVDRVMLLFDSKLDSVGGWQAPVELAYDLARKDRYDAPGNAEEFGWQLGMGWVGQGTAIPQAGRDLLSRLGHGEVNVEVRVDRTGAPGKASLTHASLPKIPTIQANRRRRSSRRRSSRKR